MRMELPHIICFIGQSSVIVILLINMSQSLAVLQGKGLPDMTSDVNEVSGKSFEYIIVGGGAAGCALAATISEKFSVLLVERGGSPYGNPLTQEQFYGLALQQTDEYSSIAQNFTSKEGVRNHRGRVLGGSSAINAGFYSRASHKFIADAGWDKELVKESYEWVESIIVSKPNELTNFQSNFALGLLEAGFSTFNGFTWEHIEGTKIGGTILDQYGERHTAGDLLRAGYPENIVVLLNATVKNVIFRKNGDEIVAQGIRFIRSDGNITQTYKSDIKQSHSDSRGDVILSAGALGSPQILLLSGIGPKDHLQKQSIPVVLDLESVGREMQDNPAITFLADSKPGYTSPETPQVAGIAKEFKYIVEGGLAFTSINQTRMRVGIKLAFPESKGKLELNNTDPRQNPLVEFNYLKKGKDMDECVNMVRLLNKISTSQTLSGLIGSQPTNVSISNAEEVKEYCKQNVRTYYHYHGGCNVGRVVDTDYRVFGVKGLRVIDGSTFWESPGTNPMATVLMLGRYQGIKILKEREKL